MIRAVTLSLVSCLVWGPALLAQQKSPKPAEKKKEMSDAKDLERAQHLEMDRLQRRIREAIARARRGGGVRPAPVKVAKADAVRQALAEVQRAVSRAQREPELKAMQDELDKAEKALMKARRELWKRLRAQQAPRKATGESKSQPASRPASRPASVKPATSRGTGR